MGKWLRGTDQLLNINDNKVEVLIDLEKEEIVTLGELTPKWWI